MRSILLGVLIYLVVGCASIDFDSPDEGLTYYEMKPYLFYSVTDKCVAVVSVVSVPGEKKRMKFNSGYGASELSAEFSNGVVTKIGQTSDSKVPETLASIASLATAGVLSTGESTCTPSAVLYPIIEGVPDVNAPLHLKIAQ